jgi:hypothetical protein
MTKTEISNDDASRFVDNIDTEKTEELDKELTKWVALYIDLI